MNSEFEAGDVVIVHDRIRGTKINAKITSVEHDDHSKQPAMQGARLMRCGACGNATIRMYQANTGYKLYAQCQACHSVTVIKASVAICWPDDEIDSNGILTVFS